MVDAVLPNGSPWGQFPGNREKTGNFDRKHCWSANSAAVSPVKSIVCRRIPYAQEQGINSSDQGKNTAGSGNSLARARNYQERSLECGLRQLIIAGSGDARNVALQSSPSVSLLEREKGSRPDLSPGSSRRRAKRGSHAEACAVHHATSRRSATASLLRFNNLVMSGREQKVYEWCI